MALILMERNEMEWNKMELEHTKAKWKITTEFLELNL